jgi:uncharacterized protein with NAD-binding domain and iron-sulfur cluster
MAALDSNSTPISRRRFLRDAGLAAITASELFGAPGLAAARPRLHTRRRPTVAVFGGGIAGLTVAHELAERGFEVTVYEPRAWGGKARSMQVPHSASDGRKPLPGEHGYRVEFGFYQNLPDTMRRIPFASNQNGVLDNLVAIPEFVAARAGGRRDIVLPVDLPNLRAETPEKAIDLLIAVLVQTNAPPDAVAHFVNRMVVYFSSCDARRHEQWENTSWTDFIGASSYPDDYRKLFGDTFSQLIEASKADSTAANFSAMVVELVLYNLIGRGATGPAFRALNRPTNEAWIGPWLTLLRRLGVRLQTRHELTGLNTRAGRIASAGVKGPRGTRQVKADWYVCALPVERARRLWTEPILEADPELADMWQLPTGWMNGIQFYLRRNAPLVDGYLDCADSPWAISSINQAQFWVCDFAATYGDGQVRDCLSAVASNWTAPGVLFGKPASGCTPQQIAREVWEQIKRHVNKPGQPPRLTDDLLHTWSLDPGMLRRRDGTVSQDPLALPAVGCRPHRPDVATAIPNLLLAGDYLKGDWEVASMEAANYNARRAANAVLEIAGSRESPCATIERYRPPEWEPFRTLDDARYKRRQPNVFDTDLSLEQIKNILSQPLERLRSATSGLLALLT